MLTACVLPSLTVTVTVSEAPAVCGSESWLGLQVCLTSSQVPASCSSATAAPLPSSEERTEAL
jgi:hypothetical protein